MKGIRIEKYGNENVLQFQQLDVPGVTESTVLVKVIAAGVNPVDTYIRAGAFSNLPDLPFTPGKDGSGIVEKMGSNITKVQVGQRVFICGLSLGKYGTYAEYALVPENQVFPLPDFLSFAEGAALGIPYFTAYRALFIKCQCSSSSTVFVHGASGAVGLAAIQLAKNAGMKVIASAGTDVGMALVKETGADCVVCHKEKNYMEKVMEATDNMGVSCVLEMLANINLDKDLDILAGGGRVAIIGSRGTVKIDPRKMMGKESQVMGIALLRSNEDEWLETSEAVLKVITEGQLRPPIDRSYPLEKASEAHKDIIHSKGAKGKLILTIQGP